NTVRSGLVTAWRFAIWPTSCSPWSVNATIEGVVRAPSALGMTWGSPPSMSDTHELVVPRSIPITFPIVSSQGGKVGPLDLAVPVARCLRDHHPGRPQQPIPQPVTRLVHLHHRVGRQRSVFLLRHRFVHVRIERLPCRLDPGHAVFGEGSVEFALHELDALQHSLEVPAAAACVLYGAIQVIDRRQQILDEILVPVAVRLLALAQVALAEVVEVGGEPEQPLLEGGRLLAQLLELAAELLVLLAELLVLLGGQAHAP